MDKQPKPKKIWSMLAYVCVDDPILSEHGKKDIQEMAKAGVTNATHVGAQIDTQGDFGSLVYEITEPDFTGKSYRVVIDRHPETYTGDKEVLKDFLEWGITRCEPQHRIIVLGGHGQGFSAPQRDAFWEGKGPGLLIPDIAELMSQIEISADIVGFDACYMNLAEIANQFRNSANIFISSQDLAPAAGWNYDQVVQSLNKELSPTELATEIVKSYETVYENNKHRTLSAIDLNKIDEVISALDQLGAILAPRLHSDKTFKQKLRKVRTRSQRFTRAMADCVDLGDFSQQLLTHFNSPDKEVLPILEASERITLACENAVIENTRGKLRSRSTGISFWFPERRFMFSEGRTFYEDLTDNYPNWLEFLDEFHSLD